MQSNLYMSCYLPLVVYYTIRSPFVSTDWHAAQRLATFIFFIKTLPLGTWCKFKAPQNGNSDQILGTRRP